MLKTISPVGEVRSIFRLAITMPCLLMTDALPGPAFDLCRKLGMLNGLDGIGIETVIFSSAGRQDMLGQVRRLVELGFSFAQVIHVDDPILRIDGYHFDLFLTDEMGRLENMLPDDSAIVRILGQPHHNRMVDTLNIAFDYDQTLADSDDALQVLQESGDLPTYRQFEQERVQDGDHHGRGPMHGLMMWLDQARAALNTQLAAGAGDCGIRRIKLSIVTWRSVLSAERPITSLQSWGVCFDEFHLLAGIDKNNSLQGLAPDLFLDDSIAHLQQPAASMLCGHVRRVTTKQS